MPQQRPSPSTPSAASSQQGTVSGNRIISWFMRSLPQWIGSHLVCGPAPILPGADAKATVGFGTNPCGDDHAVRPETDGHDRAVWLKRHVTRTWLLSC